MSCECYINLHTALQLQGKLSQLDYANVQRLENKENTNYNHNASVCIPLLQKRTKNDR